MKGKKGKKNAEQKKFKISEVIKLWRPLDQTTFASFSRMVATQKPRRQIFCDRPPKLSIARCLWLLSHWPHVLPRVLPHVLPHVLPRVLPRVLLHVLQCR